MRLAIVLCFASGCGFASRAASDGGVSSSGDGNLPQRDARAPDATPPDAAALDGAGSGSGDDGATDCFASWIDHAVQFTAPRQMTELSSPITPTLMTSERDPWISQDGLRLYFSRSRGTQGGSDIYLATRPSLTASFGNPMDLLNLSGSSDDDRPALSSDELTIAIAREPPAASPGKAHILLARRDQPSAAFPSPDDVFTKAINADNADHLDPFLSRDGLRLYLAPTGAGGQQIMMATRASTGEGFSEPAAVRGVARVGAGNADPAVFDDERILVFSSTDITGTNLWYATRSSAEAEFGTPRAIASLNTTASDGDPMLSADGCELYFSSTRGSERHIYHAVVKR